MMPPAMSKLSLAALLATASGMTTPLPKILDAAVLQEVTSSPPPDGKFYKDPKGNIETNDPQISFEDEEDNPDRKNPAHGEKGGGNGTMMQLAQYWAEPPARPAFRQITHLQTETTMPAWSSPLTHIGPILLVYITQNVGGVVQTPRAPRSMMTTTMVGTPYSFAEYVAAGPNLAHPAQPCLPTRCARARARRSPSARSRVLLRQALPRVELGAVHHRLHRGRRHGHRNVHGLHQ